MSSTTQWPAIQDACDRPLFTSAPTSPDVSDGIRDWGTTVEFVRIIKQELDFQIVEKAKSAIPALRFFVQGLYVPLTFRQLQIKPEGQRRWKWRSLTTASRVELLPDDETFFEGMYFRVVADAAWTNNGVTEYHLLQATGGPITP